nr:hypothetical protein [Streptomyces clavuligerus]
MTLRKIGHGGRGPVGVLAQGGLMERTAVLRLDAEWTKVRAGRAAVPPGERERMLLDLISALAPHAANDLPLTARLSLRYADLARHHFDAGRRVKALRAVAEAVRHCAEPARHDEEHARWYARALLSQSVYLAEPLSDELGLPRYAFPARGERPPAAARADGIAALEATRRAMAVWEGLPGGDPRNREGLAQSRAFLGDRLEELGDPVEAVVWAVRAEQEFHALGERPGAPHGTALEHLGDQLVRRLRRCGFQGGLTRLRAEGLLPGRLLPLAVVASNKVVARQIVLYSWVMVGVSLLLTPMGYTGWFYTAGAAARPGGGAAGPAGALLAGGVAVRRPGARRRALDPDALPLAGDGRGHRPQRGRGGGGADGRPAHRGGPAAGHGALADRRLVGGRGAARRRVLPPDARAPAGAGPAPREPPGRRPDPPGHTAIAPLVKTCTRPALRWSPCRPPSPISPSAGHPTRERSGVPRSPRS